MLVSYGLSLKPRFDGDSPTSMVLPYRGWLIHISTISKGFSVYRNPFAKVSYTFSSIKEVKTFIFNQSTLFDYE